jgi:hypothetical protein
MACLSKNMKAFIAVAALFVLALAQNDQVLSASCRDRNVSRSAASQLAESAPRFRRCHLGRSREGLHPFLVIAVESAGVLTAD